jgi:hypothetical protein
MKDSGFNEIHNQGEGIYFDKNQQVALPYRVPRPNWRQRQDNVVDNLRDLRNRGTLQGPMTLNRYEQLENTEGNRIERQNAQIRAQTARFGVESRARQNVPAANTSVPAAASTNLRSRLGRSQENSAAGPGGKRKSRKQHKKSKKSKSRKQRKSRKSHKRNRRH